MFFLNYTATTEIYTLSLHDALPILVLVVLLGMEAAAPAAPAAAARRHLADRKSTRLNSSHANISYAVFCLKKKNTPDLPERDAYYTEIHGTDEDSIEQLKHYLHRGY